MILINKTILNDWTELINCPNYHIAIMLGQRDDCIAFCTSLRKQIASSDCLDAVKDPFRW